MATFETVEEEEAYSEQLYEENYNTDAYLKTYYTDSTPYHRIFQGPLHNVFATEVTSGETLLDIGASVNIHTMIHASNRFKNIVAGNMMQSNNDFIRKWLDSDPDCHDISTVFKTAAALEMNKNYHEVEERVRESVKELIPCNVHLANPIAPDDRKFDVVVSSYILEGISQSLESYRKSIVNMARLLNPGGKFVICGALEFTYYNVGDHKFPVPYLTKDTVNQAMVDAGLQPVHWVLVPLVQKGSASDCMLFFIAVAKKPID